MSRDCIILLYVLWSYTKEIILVQFKKKIKIDKNFELPCFQQKILYLTAHESFILSRILLIFIPQLFFVFCFFVCHIIRNNNAFNRNKNVHIDMCKQFLREILKKNITG